MILRQLETLAFSYNEFVWWVGKVEDVEDPNKAGRVKVKIYGYYDAVKKEGLPWALCIHPIISAAYDGYGYSPTNIMVGSTVVGFFADGHDALTPIIFATVGSEPTGERKRYGSGESDVNRLARGIADDKMIPQKMGKLDVGVKRGFGGTWSEPPTPFATEYPKGYVFESKCGHIQEFDSTDGAERINTFHKDGSFEEYHPKGTKVDRIIKDKYTIVHNDEFKHVKGDSTITIDFDGRIRIEGDAFIHVEGNMNQYVKGNYKLRVDGNLDTEIKGSKTTTVAGSEVYQVGGKFRHETKSRSDMVKGSYYIDVCGNLDIIASKIYISPIIIVGGGPKCEHTELPPLFPGINLPDPDENGKARRMAPRCKNSKVLTPEEIAKGYKTCDAANHGPCWPYCCDPDPNAPC